jgi:hypothetical protein
MSDDIQPEGPAVPGVTRWRQKGGEVEAVRLTPGNGSQVWEWAESKPHYATGGIVDGLTVYGTGGREVASFGDWVVRFPAGTFRVFSDSEFTAAFEPAPEPLVMPPDEFEATRTVAERMGLAEPAPGAPEPGEASTGAVEGIPAAWVTAGISGVIALHKLRRDAYWNCPSGDEGAAFIAAVRPLIQAAERERIRPLVAQWRTGAGHLASSNAAWSSHFYDCANELERLIGTEGDSRGR